MSKVISILFITFFYSSYSFSICKFNPNPIGNTYVPDQTIYVQYDQPDGALKTIRIPITSSIFRYATTDSNYCDFNFMGRWKLTWKHYLGNNTLVATNIPGIILQLQLLYSSPQLGTGLKNVNFYDYHVPENLTFTSMTWALTIRKIGPVTQSGVLPAGQISYLRVTKQGGRETLDAGNLYFRSNFRISVANCSIKNSTLNINLGDWYDTQFPTVGSTSSEVDIPITLNCLAGTNIKATVVGTSGVINASQGHLGLSGTDKATGIAIQLVDANKNPIPLGSKQTIKSNVAAGEHIFGWKARYIKTADKITPGSANASATVNIRYE
ncbi:MULTISPECIES: fimbrial protein [Providencia]|uniref:fimbrial protein n=1 Tax=Providencia TaxID=586 RepID=UPI000F770C56|nr:fimbrial protein [Providencia rettgeri]ELR5221990.1 fimbrial protein [Providencia rettgeri]MBV2188678.1 fimbrial protein [Providencia rettgeri]MDX7322029.1 fimbrial protein [Providencia rettgeri]